MSRLLKWLLLAIAGIVALVIVAAVALLLLFDPNDFRERIAAEVEEATGRELVIEGDLAVSLFPWLAVEMGSTRLGNAKGFGDKPFASFDTARLSVQVLPLLLRREITVGDVELDGLRLELAVNRAGTTNWDDLTSADTASTSAADETQADGASNLDISGVELRNSYIHYNDAQSGSDYTLQNLSMNTGRVVPGEAFDFSGNGDFESSADEIDGVVQAAGRLIVSEDFATLTFAELTLDGMANGIASQPAEFQISASDMVADIDNSKLQPTRVSVTILGALAELDIKSASWADDVIGEATLNVEEFSPREMAPLFDVEVPPTADPAALTSARFSAQAAMDANAIGLRNLKLSIDDTALTGEIILPFGETAPIRFDLEGDSMNLDRYMEPASESGTASGSAASDDFEIPVDMIRGINARGTLKLSEATFADMTFTNIQLGLNSAAGKLRLNPVSADLFDGTYTGDVQVDASGAVPKLSLNEKVADVSLTPLGKAMFERDKLSGTINGSFVLNTSGPTLSVMRSNLNGTMAFELADGAWQGVDLWYQLRAARALYRREQPPEKREPVRTDFSSVLATGVVTNGVFENKDLQAQMPYLQLTGQGTVNFVTAEMDYSLRARVLERPEFLEGASDEELAEFTEALIPVRIRGPLLDPTVRPDIEGMFRDQVEEKLKEKGDELKKRLLDRLVPSAPADETVEAAEGGEAAVAEEEPSAEDELKKRLKKIFD
ncbi:MAG: AsmA family protein [Woeseia sp.]|nr:AsmA family protein [Woeseia sp.]MBT8097001.1 AsmA family protein [Woeseia sp.]NNE59730.1 AsmA family protein [Woeseia sp.]NNL54755.1 AsmA family protein [Woeseia sp.]